jgi:hypothetical protein
MKSSTNQIINAMEIIINRLDKAKGRISGIEDKFE